MPEEHHRRRFLNLIVLVQEDLAKGNRAILRGRRATHIHKVLRASVGDALRVGLVNGPKGNGLVVSMSGEQVELEVELSQIPEVPLPSMVLVSRPKILKRVLQAAAAFGIERMALMESWRVEKSFRAARCWNLRRCTSN